MYEPMSCRPEAAGDRWSYVNIDNRAECAEFKISWVFETCQQDRFNDECLPGGNSLHEDNKYRPPNTRKWLSSSCCHGLPGRTPVGFRRGSVLTHLNRPPPPQTVTPPHQLLHLKSSITFSGGSDAGLSGALQHAEERQRWEVLIPSEGGPVRLWPSLPALAHWPPHLPLLLYAD